LIYVPFGDSHSLFLGGASPSNTTSLFRNDTPSIFWIGPAKIWGLKNSSINNTKEKFERLRLGQLADPNVVPIASFGEIDIRVNLGKKCIVENSFAPITELVEMYLSTISALPAKQVLVWGPPPTTYESEDLTYPAFLDSISRNTLTHLFNKELLRLLPRYPKVKFCTLFYEFVDRNMITTGGLSDGIHYDLKYVSSAREMIRRTLNSELRTSVDIKKLLEIPNPEFVPINLSSQDEDRCSSQLYDMYEPLRLRFFLHRQLQLVGSKMRIVQIRPTQMCSLKTYGTNEAPPRVIETANAIQSLYKYYGQSIKQQLLKIVEDYHNIEGFFFDAVSEDELKILRKLILD
jgi:hypothetical protein